MHLSFLLFIVAFIVALYLSLKILRKLKESISTTKSKENSLRESIGEDPKSFHRVSVMLMAYFAQKLRFDVGTLQFIYNYIMNAVPQKFKEVCILDFVNSTCVLVNNNPCAIIDINKTIKKGQLILIDKNLALLSAAHVNFNLHTDDDSFVHDVQILYGKFSETGRKYMAYLLCKSVCEAQRYKSDFSSLSGLVERAFDLSAGDVQTLVTYATENNLAEWYAKHIQSDVNRNYPPYDKFADILRVEFPAMPPYDWKEKCVKSADWWCAALYMLLSIIVVWGFYIFRGPFLLFLLAIFPLLILCPVFSLASVFSHFFEEGFMLERNRYNWKPTTIHQFVIVYTFALFLLLSIKHIVDCL